MTEKRKCLSWFIFIPLLWFHFRRKTTINVDRLTQDFRGFSCRFMSHIMQWSLQRLVTAHFSGITDSLKEKAELAVCRVLRTNLNPASVCSPQDKKNQLIKTNRQHIFTFRDRKPGQPKIRKQLIFFYCCWVFNLKFE